MAGPCTTIALSHEIFTCSCLYADHTVTSAVLRHAVGVTNCGMDSAGGASGGVHVWAGADCLTTVPCGRSWGTGVLVPIGGFENADPTPGMGAVDGRGLEIFCIRVLTLLAVSVPGSLAHHYRIPRNFFCGGGAGGARTMWADSLRDGGNRSRERNRKRARSIRLCASLYA